MQNIEQKALTTFQNNLTYFEKKHPEIYQKILLLNTLIAEGKYIEKYSLEYKNEGYFDILELETNAYLYKENSIKSSQRMVDGYDLKRTGAVFKAQRYVQATDEQAEYVDKSELSFHNTLWATIKIINYVEKHTGIQTHMVRSNKIIFLGIGLGLYIEDFIKKLKARVLFIKEKNFETFRLSLFVVDYGKVLQDCSVHFSLTDNIEEERENFLNFLNEGNNYNLYMKHIPFTQNYQVELQALQSHVLSQEHINYGYNAELLRFIDSPKYLVQNYAFLNIMKKYYGMKDNIISEKPVLMVFSGPSTFKNIEWLQSNRERFIVVSALSTCRLLSTYDISPDIVIHIDPGEETSLALFESIGEEYFKDTLTILSSNVHEEVIKKFKRENIYIIEQGSSYKKDFGSLSAPSVGEYTYALMMIFGVSKMFMLGVDLALDPETMQTHGGYHPYQNTGQVDTSDASLDANTSSVYVKGNFLEQVPALVAHTISLEQVEIFTKALKKEHHKIYNLSNGAYLEGCEPLHVEDFDWTQFEVLDRKSTKESLDYFFTQISEAKFNQNDKAQLKYQIKEARKLEKVIKAQKKKRFVNVKAFVDSLATLSFILSDMENKTGSNLSKVYYNYFQIILSFIFDLFNTQELVAPQKHIAPLNNLLAEQLLKISKTYIKKLEAYLKE